MFLTSKKLEDVSAKTPTCELLIPVQLFWEVEQLLKRLDYLIASHEDPVIINDLSLRIYRKVVKYVVSEKDRLLLHARINGPG